MQKIKEAKIYGGKHIIQFIEDKDVWPEIHEYHLDGELVELTGSKIVKVLDKPALVGWAAKMCGVFLQENSKKIPSLIVNTLTGPAVDEIALGLFIEDMKGYGKGKKKEAATIGTMAHVWIEGHIKNILELGSEPARPINEAVNNSIDAFLKWEKGENVRYKATERMVYSKKHKWAGTMDIEAEVNGEMSVVDNKTGSGIYIEAEYQTGGYQMAAEEEAKFIKKPIKYDSRWVLNLNKVTGELKTKRFTDHEDAQKGFLACLVLARLAMAKEKEREKQKVWKR